MSSAITSLNAIVVWLIVGGVIVAIAAFLATRPTWVQAMGRGFSKLFGVASDLTAPETGAGRWAAAHMDVLQVAGVAVAVILLLFMAASLSAVIVIVLVLIVYELALAGFFAGVPRLRGRRELRQLRRPARPARPQIEAAGAAAGVVAVVVVMPVRRCGRWRCGLPPMTSQT